MSSRAVQTLERALALELLADRGHRQVAVVHREHWREGVSYAFASVVSVIHPPTCRRKM